MSSSRFQSESEPALERQQFTELVEQSFTLYEQQLADLGMSLESLRLSDWEIREKAAQYVYSQWSRNRAEGKDVEVFAAARLFNRVTQRARDDLRRSGVTSPIHVQELATFLSKEVGDTNVNVAEHLESVALALDQTAQLHSHEFAWPWCVLPVFRKQHYGRTLLEKAETGEPRYPVFITQTFFLAGGATLAHTHGQNWAFARPLGEGSVNSHINRTWLPYSAEELLPLGLQDTRRYDSTSIVGIAPLTIHTIERPAQAEITQQALPSLAELLDREWLRQQVHEQVRFGEFACLHVYLPDWHQVGLLSSSPVVSANENFFVENDMIVFDMEDGEVWAGGGGAWSRRLIEYGPAGEHCGECYREQHRHWEGIDPKVAYDWLLSPRQELPVQFLR